MVFASLPFIFILLPIFLALDFALRLTEKTTLRNISLFAVSILFYIWGEVANVFLLLGLAFFNYYAGNFILKSKNPRLVTGIFVALNLAVLIGFKYAYWLISLILPDLVSSKPSMPLGISFFTFHAISYLVDIYRRQVAPAKTSLDFLTYFCMFPHLVAGPIVRFAHVNSDLGTRGPDKDLFAFGLYRFFVGLNKKIIIANSVAIIVDYTFSMSSLGKLHFFDAWIGIIAYAVQIYFDFSGYSDMAIGLAAMAGFRFEENFRRPYSSVNIRDFWRRWHISLSSWLRDYLYIPLGGSKGSKHATYINLLLVFFLCGLWHGADFTFVLWGLWHGMFLILERLPVGRFIDKLPSTIARVYTTLVVLIGWVFFRADDFNAAMAYFYNMFSFSIGPVSVVYYTTSIGALIAGICLCMVPDKWLPAPESHNPASFSVASYCLQAVLAVASIVMLLTSSRNPFIYYNF